MSSEEYNAISARLDRIEQLALISAKPVLDVKEAATYVGFSVKHLYRLTSERRIPHFKMNAKLYFKKSELEHWLTRHRVSTTDEIENRAATYCSLKRLESKAQKQEV